MNKGYFRLDITIRKTMIFLVNRRYEVKLN
jgi:hypothetical protein